MKTLRVEGRPLDAHERRYLAMVDAHLRDVRRANRDDLLREVYRHLSDRRPTASEAALWSEIGAPDSYAHELRVEHGLGPERRDWWARWTAVSRAKRAAIVVVLVLALAVPITAVRLDQWWLNWHANIEDNGFGLTYSGADPVAGIVETETISSSQRTAPYRANRRLQLGLLLSADHSLRITKIEFPTSPVSMLGLDRVEIAPAAGSSGLQYRPFSGLALPDGPGHWIRLTFHFRDCEFFGAGDYQWWDHIAVTYEALGRTRHADVALGSVVAVTAPPDSQCPSRKP